MHAFQTAKSSLEHARFHTIMRRSVPLGIGFGIGIGATGGIAEGDIWDAALFGLIFAVGIVVASPLWSLASGAVSEFINAGFRNTALVGIGLGGAFYFAMYLLLTNLTFPDVPSSIAMLVLSLWVSVVLGLRLK